ncbi:MAG TPA: NAD synthetase [Bdellovibrionales bacterium]|nr:MAG: NAD synthetase [Bdellovibrionales bacterium GWA1_52_35]OFZ36618.1 MAG: NAD synthetase [Bdellovibrionales bacterium GWC1_52_8]HAR42136.1 NAD synthetase [Bdellovibrionales bacterium]HCM39812.1 NAD synthetase [Bdellovibrionales bacterium]
MNALNPDFFAFVYLIATILFILGLKGLASPRTALRGNLFAMIGMTIAVIATVSHPDVTHYTWILAGLAAGALIGTVVALKIEMTSMPELVAALHSFVGLSAVLVAAGTYYDHMQTGHMDTLLLYELAAGSFIGAVTFTGSIVAWGKLKGTFSGNPLVFKGQHLLNLLLSLAMIGCAAAFIMDYTNFAAFLIMTAIAFALGVMLVVPIGGADMPVVVSMLNSYSGWAAAATGFTLNNNLLITTGALVGSSGAILSYIMCKAMNRGFFSVILGGFGGEATVAAAAQPGKGVKSAATEDVAFMLENSSKVIIVPGYGMAVAQAQHATKELYETLTEKGVSVKFAIHPVAGRMPGHMNVLLAESEIPYDSVFEMDEINAEFSTCDVALIVGANDVVNPDAKTNKASPLYGMPILEAYKAKQVFVNKRSMKAGYAGVDNALFYYPNCSLVFGDAKGVIEQLVNQVKGTGH